MSSTRQRRQADLQEEQSNHFHAMRFTVWKGCFDGPLGIGILGSSFGFFRLLFALIPIVFLLEFLDPAGAVNVLHLPRIKRMAIRTDFYIQLWHRASGFKRISATARDHCFHVIGVDALFHRKPANL